MGEASEGLESPSEVVGADEIAQVGSQLVVRVVEVAFEGCVLDGSVHAFDLPAIRYEIRWHLAVRLFSEGSGNMVSPSGTRGAGSTKVGQAADRHWAESPNPLHGRSLRLSRMRRERGSVDVA